MSDPRFQDSQRQEPEPALPLLALVEKRLKQLRRTCLLPLTSKEPNSDRLCIPKAKSHRVAGEFSLDDHGGRVRWELQFEPEREPGQLRLNVEGSLPGEPIALLVGPDLNFWSGEPAVGQIKASVLLPDAGADQPAEDLLSLAADDGDDEDEVGPVARANSKTLGWQYDGRVLAIEADAPGETALVAVEIYSAAEPSQRSIRLERLDFRTTSGRLKKNVFDLDLESFDAPVELSVGPVRPEDPAHVKALLAQTPFVALPITRQSPGTLSCDFRWDDQHLATADPNNGWALQLAAEGVNHG